MFDILFDVLFVLGWALFFGVVMNNAQYRQQGEDLRKKYHREATRAAEWRAQALRYRVEIEILRNKTGTAPPPPPQPESGRKWKTVLGFNGTDRPTREQVIKRYKELAMKRHPDRGGTVAAMAQLNVARDTALREVAA